MKFLVNSALAAAMVLSLSGCIVVGGDHDWNDEDWRVQQKENREIISELELNTERSRVLTRLGAPNFSEAFTKDGDDYRILFYRTQHRHSDGDTTKDETTPLVFKNDKLIGWGEKILDSVR
ncbi:MAG: DUF3192 domain-containing protein [Kangiellaceae bacterium]|nr:DUF3192 domain-containing protein [Kangiellaceae bacterium]MCW9017660.1 DUF3192 domain-containing protein [Kangiellaceae bacterium]